MQILILKLKKKKSTLIACNLLFLVFYYQNGLFLKIHPSIFYKDFIQVTSPSGRVTHAQVTEKHSDSFCCSNLTPTLTGGEHVSAGRFNPEQSKPESPVCLQHRAALILLTLNTFTACLSEARSWTNERVSKWANRLKSLGLLTKWTIVTISVAIQATWAWRGHWMCHFQGIVMFLQIIHMAVVEP